MRYLLELLAKAKRNLSCQTTASAYLKMAHAEAFDKAGYIKNKLARARFEAACVCIYEACENAENVTEAVMGAHDFWKGFADGSAGDIYLGGESAAYERGYRMSKDTPRP